MAALLLLAPSSAVAGQGRDAVANGLEAGIGAVAPRIPRLMDRDGVPGLVVVVLRRGALVASAAFGFADPASGRRMSVDALFRVESISKPVTAWGVLRLVEAGALGLDDPVQAHLVRWAPPPATPPLPVVELLSNTAGVGLGDYSARFPPEGPVPPLSASLDGDFEQVALPGEEFRYSDTGFNLLQLVVEDVTGRPFDAFMEAEVLAPLEMTGATYRWTAERAEQMPVGHSLRGAPVAPYVYPGLGSGGLLATAQAIGRFAVASMEPPWGSGRPVLTDDAVRRLHRERVAVGGLYGVVADGYGLGHFTERLSDGRHAVWHGGQGYGWMSHVHVVPSSGDGIVLLANSQRAWPLFAAVLGSWSRTLGVEPVKMARIGWARPLALAAIASMLVGAMGVGRGWLRRPAADPIGPVSNSIRAGVGVSLLAVVGWSATREYLFLFSVLPGISAWLGAAAALLALVLVASAVPCSGPRRTSIGSPRAPLGSPASARPRFRSRSIKPRPRHATAKAVEKAFVELNGVKQGMFITRTDPSLPVLLHLHGGMPEFFLDRRHPSGLEHLFTVVWWEQRGAGLSFQPRRAGARVTVDQLIDDTVTLAEGLCRRFDQPRIHLMAHSGGTFIGIQAVARAPELFHAYLGVAQISDQLESEMQAYRFMTEEYRRRGETRLVRRLERSPVTEEGGTPPAYLRVRDPAMHRLGVGTMRSMRSVVSGILLPSLLCTDYTVAERAKLWMAKTASGTSVVWDTIVATDLRDAVPEVGIPVYLLHGVHDRTCSYSLARDYFHALDAPRKGFYSFERSAHSPHFEEPERMRRILKDDVLRGRMDLADPGMAGGAPLPPTGTRGS